MGLDTKYLKGDYKKIARFDFTEGWLQKKGYKSGLGYKKKRTKVSLDTKYLKGDYKKIARFDLDYKVLEGCLQKKRSKSADWLLAP